MAFKIKKIIYRCKYSGRCTELASYIQINPYVDLVLTGDCLSNCENAVSIGYDYDFYASYKGNSTSYAWSLINDLRLIGKQI